MFFFALSCSVIIELKNLFVMHAVPEAFLMPKTKNLNLFVLAGQNCIRKDRVVFSAGIFAENCGKSLISAIYCQ